MPLLTLTTFSSIKRTSNWPHLTFNAEVSPSTNGFTSKDKGGLKLVQELNKEPISVRVVMSLMFTGEDPRNPGVFYLYDLQLELTSGEGNILGELWNRFMDEIKVSIDLTPISLTGVLLRGPVFSTEQMTITSGKCMSRLAPLHPLLHRYICGMDDWELTIQIYVPNHLPNSTSSEFLILLGEGESDEDE